MVSVVICAYNAERTMLPCLESLRRLNYPNYEVIIVDDGSRDRTAEISMDFPEFRLIRQPNKGLSVARNVGLYAARGEIIAYTDSDCVVDPHWLTLMVRAMAEKNFDGCGGPNYAPHEEGRVEGCCRRRRRARRVMCSPPTIVAEHLAGCNMVFTKAALVAVGGFDAQFTSAGDDVDICWRILDAGLHAGLSARRPSSGISAATRSRPTTASSAVTAAPRRCSISKYPERFNVLGQIKWRGTIPGLAATVPGGCAAVSDGRGAAGAPQTVRDEVPGILSFLPQTLEWNLVFAAAAVFAWLRRHLPCCPRSRCSRSAWCGRCTTHGRRRSRNVTIRWARGCSSRALPGADRWCERGLDGRPGCARLPSAMNSQPRQRPSLRWLGRSLHLSYWNEAWTTRESLLERVARRFSRAGLAVTHDPGWNDFDLEVRPDPWTRLHFKTADEEHEGARLKNHVAVRVRMSRLTLMGLALAAGATVLCAAMGLSVMAAVLTALTMASAMCAVSQAVESGRLAYQAVEQCAHELNLIPLGTPTAAARRAAAEAAPSVAAEPTAASAKLFADNRTAAD